MTLFSTSPAARTALLYITAGSQMLVWTAVWLVYLANNPPQSNTVYYWACGLLASGVVLLALGFGVGSIGRSAHKAEVHPVTPVQAAPVTVAATPVAAAPAAPPAAAGPAPQAPVTSAALQPANTTAAVSDGVSEPR